MVSSDFPRRHWVATLIVLLLVVGAVWAVTPHAIVGRSSGNNPDRRRPGADSVGPVPVTIGTATERPVPLEIDAIGTIVSLSQVDIRSQVTGQLVGVQFTEGQDVRSGQLLFSLDERPFQVAVSQAEAALSRDNAQLANARLVFGRTSQLVGKGILSRDQLDQATATAQALEATVAADEASVKNARLQLQYTRIASPVNGRAGALQVHRGDLVRATDTTPLVVIQQVAPIAVSFSVPGTMLDEVRQYQRLGPLPVRATEPHGGEEIAEGRLWFIDNQIDPASGTILMKGQFPNSDRRLWPGEFVDVALHLTTEPSAVVVPATAVQPGQQGSYVFVVGANRTVEARTVTVARTIGPDAVIARGLRPGEQVVLDGQLRLTPGATVQPKGGPAGRTE